MSSNRAELPDLERDLPTTPEDVAALRWIRDSGRLDFGRYLEWVSRFDLPQQVARRRRTHEGCKPFEL